MTARSTTFFLAIVISITNPASLQERRGVYYLPYSAFLSAVNLVRQVPARITILVETLGKNLPAPARRCLLRNVAPTIENTKFRIYRRMCPRNRGGAARY